MAIPTILRPRSDPLLVEQIKAFKLPDELDIKELRKVSDSFYLSDVLKAHPGLDHKEYTTPSSKDNVAGILLSTFRPKSSNPHSNKLNCLYFIHGGGQISGTRFAGLAQIMAYFDGLDFAVVSVDYRVAPEYPAPMGLNDCYSGLVWTVEHAEELGIDAEKILVLGGSGGAPLAAGSVLMARDKQYPAIYAQMLLTPMLDDRDSTVSSKQFHSNTPWSGITNTAAWDMVLGSKRGRPDVSVYSAPARATDLSNLPPTFIDAGECEVFRDEAVAFASKMWECGSTAELHVWPGAHHGFDILDASVPVARDSVRAKKQWIRRVYGYGSQEKLDGAPAAAVAM